MAQGETIPLAFRIAPGLKLFPAYRREWLRHDLVAGVSVAAVALPTAIAYAQLAGFDPVVGLYASILPLLVYALFGTSRQLIVNPDAATCAMVAAIVAPLAGGDPGTYLSLSVVLAVLTGLACIAGGFFRLGFLADFLSKPILIGYLGIALSIILGQIGKVFGFSIESGGIIPRLIEFAGKLPQTHLPTLAVGAVARAVVLGVRRFFPRLPSPLLAVMVAVALVKGLRLDDLGVAIVGEVPAGLPELRLPDFSPRDLDVLLGGAISLALVSFSSMMVTARSFAARRRYDIDVDREFTALGACNIAAGISQGFAVSGADSRTAMGDVMGGKSQVTGLVAAVVMALVLLWFTEPLISFVPNAALGAVLISAALGLFDIAALTRLLHVSRSEFAVALITLVGVIALGVMKGILVAIGIALLLLLIRASRPADAVLGRVQGLKGFHSVATHHGVETLPGLALYRFPAALVFFNAPYFKKRVLEIVDSRPDIEWFIVDGSPVNAVDSTGAEVLEALAGELAARGVRLGIANFRSETRGMLQRTDVLAAIGADFIFPTLKSAFKAFQAKGPALRTESGTASATPSPRGTSSNE
ncbi:MAG: SulP family inorganic anion transporter [Gammaproteobacteria bacterium]